MPDTDTDPARRGRPGLLAPLALAGDLLGGESQRSRSFLGGLVMGALVGAALAGTTWLRRRRPPR